MADRDLTARFSASTAGFTAGTNALKQKLTELNTNMEQTKQAVKQANSEMKQYAKELETLRRETNNGATATAEQRNRMQQLRDNIARTTSQIGTMRTAQQELRSQINSTNRELQNQQTAAQQVQSAAANMGDVLKANLWSSAIQSAVSRLVSSLKSAAEYCYNVGSAFEAGMSQVAAISGATASELDQLNTKAKELGASTKFTATQTAEAMNYMAMAGWNAEQMLSGIDGVMNLAAASGGDLAQTSDIVTDAITAFGLKAEDVSHFADVLAAASANANTNVSMMGETFSYCAPIAGALGFSIEDVSEAIGLMANSGVKSSMAGTALRTLFTKLSDDIKITGQNLGEVTIQTSNADGSMRSLKDILADMRSAFSQLTQSEKSTAAESVAGKYAMTGLLTLMNAGTGDVDKLRGAIENCNGATADMADTMQNNGKGAVTILQSAIEGLGIAVYDKFSDKLKDSMNGITDIVSNLTERIESGNLDATFDRMAQSLGHAADQLVRFASESLPGAISTLADFISFLVDFREEIGAVVAGITTFKSVMGLQKIVSAAVGSIKSLAAALSGAKTAQEALNVATAANPFGIVAAAIGLLVGGVIALTSAMDDCNDRMRDSIDSAKEMSKSSEDYASKADKLKNVREKYEEITRSTDDAKIKEEELKALQDELESQFGRRADGIDLVTGAFDRQADSIDGLIDKYAGLSERETDREMTSLLNGQEESTAISLDSMMFDMDTTEANAYFMQRAKDFMGYGSASIGALGGNVYFEGPYETRAKTLRALADDMIDRYNETGNEAYNTIATRLETEFAAVQQGADELAALREKKRQKPAETYTAADESAANNSYNQTIADEERRKGEKLQNEAHSDYLNSTRGDGTANVDWNDISSIKKFYQYLKNTDQIQGPEYYDQLEKYGNELLQKDSDEWRTLMAEIYQGRKNINKGTGSGSASTKDPNEEQYDSDKKYLKWRLDMGYITEEEYYENLAGLRDKYLDESSDKWRSATLEIKKYQEQKNKEKLDTIKDQYDSAIAAVDAEMKLHEREKEDEEVDKKIADIDRQLQYDRLDDYSRSQLEKKKQELLDEKEETQWQRDHEDLKDGLETVYTMAQDAYANSSAQLQDALSVASQVFGAIGTGAIQTATAMNTVNNNSVNLVMNAVAQSSEQIAQAVVRLLSSGI